jgi:hypothetical protein
MARTLGYVLPALALLLLAAHFYRAGALLLAAVSFGCVALLFVSRPVAARALQGILVLGTLEWLRTAWVLAQHRIDAGLPYLRMVAILAVVAAVTAVAAWLAGRNRHGGGPV